MLSNLQKCELNESLYKVPSLMYVAIAIKNRLRQLPSCSTLLAFGDLECIALALEQQG
jgi:hypothetical protein